MSNSATRKRKSRVSDNSEPLNAKISVNYSVLVELCDNESLATIQKFVNDGGDVNSCDDKGQTLLHIACLHNRFNVANFLLESGADVNKVDIWRRNAFEVASKIYHSKSDYQPSIIEALLERGSSFTAANDIILVKTARSGHIEVAKLYLSRSAPGSDTKPVSIALRCACESSDVVMANLFLQHGGTFAEADACLSGLSCLYMAVDTNSTNCLEMVTLILDNGADVYGEPSKLIPAFWRACDTGKGNTLVVKLLLARGVDINAIGYRGLTLLMKSCHKGRIDIFELLLANGADPNLASDDGLTPLMLAAMCRKLNRIKPLLEAGADVTAVDADGKTVLDWLQENTDMLELCKRYVDRNRPSLQPLLK